MAHEAHPHDEQVPGLGEARRVTLAAIGVNVFLTVLKFACGAFGHSQALVADGVHSLSDSTTDVAVLVGMRYWSRPPDESHPHGHGRIETIISLAIAVVLAVIAVGITYDALAGLQNDHPPPRWVALIAALAAIVGKEIIYRWTSRVGRKIKSTALMANAWHHRSDSLSSIPVVIAVLAAKIDPAWAFVDHVAAVVVSVFVLRAAWSIGWPGLKELAETAAPPGVRERIEQVALETEGVELVHALRTRYVGGGLHADLHVGVPEDLNVRQGHDISERVKNRLIEHIPNVVDVVVHLEPAEDYEIGTGPRP
ncbi:MAG: cation diffusion facilitator family transporter [Planctomycetota bacterium]